jgi:PKD repeat protein
MDTADGPNPVFTYGTTGVYQGAARLFYTRGPLDAASSIRPDGTITLVLPKSVFPNIQPGQAINVALASVRATVPSIIPSTGGTNETIPDTTEGNSYTLRPANLCLSNVAPLAVLTANVNNGLVPLAVNFSGAGSTDADAIDTIANYTFNFGDGTNDVDNGSNPTISHTFTKPGLYDVKLVVTDSRSKTSSNTAHQLIQVDTPLTGIASRKVHGAAGPFDVALPGTGQAGIECRAPGAGNSHQIIYSFVRNLTAAGTASLAQGTATVGTATIGPALNQVTVNLTNVNNAQHVAIKLDGVHDNAGAILDNVLARIDVLAGDVNASARTDSGDVTLVRNQTVSVPTQTNFRLDVNCSGRIDSGDVTVTRNASITVLP